MAIAVSSQPSYLQPVYSIQEFTLYDSANYSEDGFYYQLDVSINGETRTIKQLKDENNKAVIDVQTILQSFFESDIVDSLAWESSNIFQALTSDINHYSATAKSVWDTGSSTASLITRYIFNGVDHYDRTWDASLYEFKISTPGLFFTNYHGPREIHFNDRMRISALTGTNGGIDASFNGIIYTRYDYDGDVSTFTHNQILGYTTNYIISLGADPSVINSNAAGFITTNTEYYTMAEKNGLSETLRFNIIPEDTRYTDYYRIMYIDSMGQTDAFNFDLVPENDIDISKIFYVNDRTKRTFATRVDDKYLVRSNWICETYSEGLKDLWYTPKAYLYQNEIYSPIILNETTKKILNRHNAPLINYTLAFTMAEEYSVQQQ